MPAKTADIENGILNNLETRFGIVGRSPAMTLAIRRLLQVAPTDLTVLVTGETGTGKEVFAQALHGLSKRRKSPFVSVNCGAIPETLLESELFGHEKGAFTGAADQRKGFFESAHNGTILLDEIGEMPVATQVKLLRILENGEFSRLGSSEIRRVNVRVVAATNRDLEYEVKHGNFRQDLYFRLNSVQILLPPLRKRKQDIPYLAEYFASRAAEKNGVVFGGFTEDAIEILETLTWPGNIRELRNFIETVVTLERGQRVTPEILRTHIQPALTSGINPALPIKYEQSQDYYANSGNNNINNELIYRSLLEIRADVADLKRGLSMIMGVLAERREVVTVEPDEETVDTTDATEHAVDVSDDDEPHTNIRIEDMEKRLISEALRRSGGNRRIAAEQLGISDRTLYRKITEYHLE